LKFTNVFLLLPLLLCLAANAHVTHSGDDKPQSKKESLANVPQIAWKTAGQLPAPEGFINPIGISGAYSAFLGDYLIVAGGANFPKGHPFFEQGKKSFYSDIFVFDTRDDQLNLIARGHLPMQAGHGATVVVDNSLYLVGGKNNEQAFDSIIKLSLDSDKKPTATVIGKLPFTWDSGGAAWNNDALYVFAGKQNGQVSNQVCKYSFNSQACIDSEKTPAVPGLKRSDFPAINHKGHFYVFGGFNIAAGKDNYVLTDAYAFDFNKARWKTLPPITVDNKPFSVVGGGVASLANNQLVLLGGVNRNIFNNAIFQLTTRKGEDLEAFKRHYFSLSEADINFSRRQVIYGISDNAWHALSEKVPFFGGAGPLTVTQKGNSVYWVSGEIKPVIRSPNVYIGSYSTND
jgi:N-acetylneuraminate epimerase